jgi:hypothetical protein
LVESEGVFNHRDHTKKVGKGDKPASLSESSTHESLKKKFAHHKKKHQERGNAENVRERAQKKYDESIRINPTGVSKRELKNPAESTGNLMKKDKKDNFASHNSNTKSGNEALKDVVSANKAYKAAGIDDLGEDLPAEKIDDDKKELEKKSKKHHKHHGHHHQ